jgi:hypothetical protein
MALFISMVVGISLILAGLLLLAHLSYETHRKSLDDGSPDQSDPEGGCDMNLKPHHPKKVNDCPIPLCVFQLAAVANHETWIVAFLMGGSAVLTVSVLTNHVF